MKKILLTFALLTASLSRTSAQTYTSFPTDSTEWGSFLYPYIESVWYITSLSQGTYVIEIYEKNGNVVRREKFVKM